MADNPLKRKSYPVTGCPITGVAKRRGLTRDMMASTVSVRGALGIMLGMARKNRAAVFYIG